MKFIAIAAAALLAVAAPAVAAPANNFVGLHADITAGFNDVKNHHDGNDVNYGATIGADAPLGTDFVIGLEANADNVFQSDRQYGGAARLGYALTPHVLAYGKFGYQDWHTVYNHDLSGYRYGGGAQVALTQNLYAKAEYRRSEFGHDVHTDGVLGGFGIRF